MASWVLKYTEVPTIMLIINSPKINSKILFKTTNGSMVLQGIQVEEEPKILVGLIMTPVCVRIGMTRGLAHLVTAVFIYMIAATIKLDGKCKRITKNSSIKDGRELWTRISMKSLIILNNFKDTNRNKHVSIAKKS